MTPTRRLPDGERPAWNSIRQCQDPDHNPPSMMVWEPGTYEHTCPRCGMKMQFTVPPKPTSNWRD